jgi:hypothetical protein
VFVVVIVVSATGCASGGPHLHRVIFHSFLFVSILFWGGGLGLGSGGGPVP